LHTHPVVLSRLFDVDAPVAEGDWPGRRYNIAPTQPVAAIFDDRDAGQRRMALMHWGLIPRWAKDPNVGQRMINARSESAATKPAFKHAVRYRRCIIPADGFFEWQKTNGGKQPFYIHGSDAVLPMAGLYEHWFGPNGEEIDSCTILTTEANRALADLHPRMPVVLAHADVDRWLDAATQKAEAVEHLLRPMADDALRLHPVAAAMNSPAHDGPSVIEPRDSSTDQRNDPARESDRGDDAPEASDHQGRLF